MAGSKIQLLVIGSREFKEFKELDNLPAEVEVVDIGTAEELLGDMPAAIFTLPIHRKSS